MTGRKDGLAMWYEQGLTYELTECFTDLLEMSEESKKVIQPSQHVNLWEGRGHGRMGSMDRLQSESLEGTLE